jgi:hypothetical protein
MSTEDWQEVTIEFLGKTIKGRYTVSGKSVTVLSWDGNSKTDQLGTFPAEKLAKMLLRELALETRTH